MSSVVTSNQPSILYFTEEKALEIANRLFDPIPGFENALGASARHYHKLGTTKGPWIAEKYAVFGITVKKLLAAYYLSKESGVPCAVHIKSNTDKELHLISDVLKAHRYRETITVAAKPKRGHYPTAYLVQKVDPIWQPVLDVLNPMVKLETESDCNRPDFLARGLMAELINYSPKY